MQLLKRKDAIVCRSMEHHCSASNALRLGEINLRNSKLSVIAQGEKTWDQLSYETSRFLKR